MRAKSKANDTIHSLKYDFKLPTTDKRLQLIQKLRDEYDKKHGIDDEGVAPI